MSIIMAAFEGSQRSQLVCYKILSPLPSVLFLFSRSGVVWLFNLNPITGWHRPALTPLQLHPLLFLSRSPGARPSLAVNQTENDLNWARFVFIVFISSSLHSFHHRPGQDQPILYCWSDSEPRVLMFLTKSWSKIVWLGQTGAVKLIIRYHIWSTILALFSPPPGEPTQPPNS